MNFPESNKGNIRPGYGFRNGKWYTFCEGGISVIRAWDPVRSWQYDSLQGWRIGFPNQFDTLCNLYFKNRQRMQKSIEVTKGGIQLTLWKTKIEKLSQFFNTIPDVEREILRQYHFGRWHILKMLESCGTAALDLFKCNPTLAFALSLARYLGSGNNHNFYRSLRALLRERQREIIGWMGFSDSHKQGIVNIFIKINPFAIRHIQDFWRLRSIINEQPNIMKMMFFLERINTDIFRIITDPALVRFVTPNFLDEVSHNKESEIIPRVAYKLKRTIEMLPANRNVKFKSLTHLHKIWGPLVDHECRISLILDREIKFCPPPFPSFRGESFVVEPLICSRSLAEESIEQENCVIDYVDIILDEEGQVYIYKVIKPERATLSIVKVNGYFLIDELKCRKNRDVSQTTSYLVSNWLKNVQHDYC